MTSTCASPCASFRHASPEQLADALQSARNYTLGLFDCLAGAGYDALARVPHIATLNPPLWELGHIAWFAEWFILRQATSSHPADAQHGCLITRGDDWFDSNTVAHRSRWTLDLPSTGAIKTYCHEVLDRTLDQLTRTPATDADLYPFRLALAHEDMHGEALLHAMQILGVGAPPHAGAGQGTLSGGEGIAYPGGSMLMGGAQADGFVFDNERTAHLRHVAPFRIDADLVSNASYIDFIEDGGYQNRQYWSASGRAWLMRQERSSPRYWQRDADQWRVRRFGLLCSLAASEPVRHLCLYEAQAYCAWAGRRLPSEAEWESAALSGQAGFRWGQLWEWTCSAFEPYPGFAPDRYREYSQPWFGTHQVLRGASFATPARFASARFRNFYLPERDDVFTGFRTCAL